MKTKMCKVKSTMDAITIGFPCAKKKNCILNFHHITRINSKWIIGPGWLVWLIC